MKCPKCGGFGKIYEHLICDRCNGTGKVSEQTNEEWFCGLTTEEKVNALLNLHKKVRQKMKTDIGGENSFYKGDYYREWLKQPHREEITRTCINCKRAEKFDDNFIKCDGLIHISMAKEMADGCLEYSPKE